MLNPDALKVARLRRRLSTSQLATAVGVSVQSVRNYENGRTSPAEGVVQQLSDALDYPLSFLIGDVEIIPSDKISFRSLARLRSKDRDAANAAAVLGAKLLDWLQSEFELPSWATPETSPADPESVAYELRARWGLGNLPVPNLMHLLEAKGVRLFGLVGESSDFDAFSFWHGPIPCICMNTCKSPERTRFDLAHELGHLMLHRHRGISGSDNAEQEADQFAGHFLIPRDGLNPVEIMKISSIEGFIRQKRHWGVSLAAYVYRLKTYNYLSDWHYRQIMIKISQNGWRSKEPQPRELEQSALWPNLLRALWRDGIQMSQIADETSIPLDELVALTFGIRPEDTSEPCDRSDGNAQSGMALVSSRPRS